MSPLFSSLLPAPAHAKKLDQACEHLFELGAPLTVHHLSCVALAFGRLDVVQQLSDQGIHPHPIPKECFKRHMLVSLYDQRHAAVPLDSLGAIRLMCLFATNFNFMSLAHPKNQWPPRTHAIKAALENNKWSVALLDRSPAPDQGSLFLECLSHPTMVGFATSKPEDLWQEHEDFIASVHSILPKPSSEKVWERLLFLSDAASFYMLANHPHIKQVYSPLPQEEKLDLARWTCVLRLHRLVESLGTSLPVQEKHLAHLLRHAPTLPSEPHMVLKVFEDQASKIALNASASAKESLLATAIQLGQFGSVKRLKEKWNVPLNWQDPKTQETLWHLGARKPSSFKALEHLGLETLQTPINTPNKKGQTMLHVASAKGALAVLRKAISHGADRTIKDHSGAYPLDCVQKYASTHQEVLPEMIKLLGKDGAIQSAHPNTLLTTGVKALSLPLVESYASLGNIHHTDDKGRGWLSQAIHAVRTNAPALARRKTMAQVLKALVKAGADVNQQDKEGNTPLHYAVLNGESIAASVLLKAGANVHLTNLKGHKPSEMPTFVMMHPGPLFQALEEILERFVRHGWVLTERDFRSLENRPLRQACLEKQALTKAIGMCGEESLAPNPSKRKM